MRKQIRLAGISRLSGHAFNEVGGVKVSNQTSCLQKELHGLMGLNKRSSKTREITRKQSERKGLFGCEEGETLEPAKALVVNTRFQAAFFDARAEACRTSPVKSA